MNKVLYDQKLLNWSRYLVTKTGNEGGIGIVRLLSKVSNTDSSRPGYKH